MIPFKKFLKSKTFGKLVYRKPKRLEVSCTINPNLGYYIWNKRTEDHVSGYYLMPLFSLDDVVQDSLKSQFKNLKL